MYTLLIIIILISLTFPLPLMFFIELIGEFVGYVYEGRGSGTTLHEQLTAELVKVRHLKTQDKFQDALKSINAILEQMPEHPDALLLKAQILWEGFQDHAFAKRCLRRVLQAKSSADDTVRQWASGLLDEIESRQI